MACCSGCRGGGSSIYALSASMTIQAVMAGRACAGASSASARTRRHRGARSVAGSRSAAFAAMIGLRSQTSWTLRLSSPSPPSGCMPTASIGSPPSWRLRVSPSPRWSIVSSSAIRREVRGSAQVGRTGWLNGLLSRWWKLDASRQGVQPADLRVELRTRARPALLGQRIARDQPEFRAVALGPLKIIETGPVKIAAYRRAGLDGTQHGGDVTQEIFRPEGVLVVRDAIFGHDDWQLLALQPSQGPVEALGVEFPIEIRPRRISREHPLAEQLSAILHVKFYELARVVIEADKILAVARATGAAGQCQRKNQPPQAQRFQDRLVEDPVERGGDGSVLRHKPPGRGKNSPVMRQTDLDVLMPRLDALVRQPMRP